MQLFPKETGGMNYLAASIEISTLLWIGTRQAAGNEPLVPPKAGIGNEGLNVIPRPNTGAADNNHYDKPVTVYALVFW